MAAMEPGRHGEAPERPRLTELLPELAERLEGLLRERGEPQLAEQVKSLRIVGACRCGHDFCGSFYTAPRPIRRWFRRGRQIEFLTELPGEVILDVVGGEIVYVEVLHWDETRDAVARACAGGL